MSKKTRMMMTMKLILELAESWNPFIVCTFTLSFTPLFLFLHYSPQEERFVQ